MGRSPLVCLLGCIKNRVTNRRGDNKVCKGDNQNVWGFLQKVFYKGKVATPEKVFF